MSPGTSHHEDIDAALAVGPQGAAHAERVLVIDDARSQLALLRDALDESGYTALTASSAAAALKCAVEQRPDVILLQALTPKIDGLDIARRLKADPATANVPLILITDANTPGQVEAAFAAGAADCAGKPVRLGDLLVRISAQLQLARSRRRAQPDRATSMPNALDAFGHASMAVHEDGRCVWQTALARALMARYFVGGHFERGRLPPEMLLWLHREALRRRAGAEPGGLTVLPQQARGETARRSTADMVARGARRLSFTLHAVDPDALGEGHWLIVMREADDAALMDALMHGLRLSPREAELLYWVAKGKSEADLGAILGAERRELSEALSDLLLKLGVSSRDAAAALALDRVKGLAAGAASVSPAA